MLKFFAGSFAIAGLIVASGPIIIHLLNRRRFRVVDWAAMDFLREAMQRNRRILRLRDLLLLLLRVLCLVLFGLALARPYFSHVTGATIAKFVATGVALVVGMGASLWAVYATRRNSKAPAIALSALSLLLAGLGFYSLVQDSSLMSGADFSSRQPVHAVLVIDNSLSMGYETLNGTLLNRAKARAIEFIDRLPKESRISVIPLCGTPAGASVDAYRAKDDTRDAIGRIEVVDRAGSALQAVDLASQACRKVPELPAKRVVFISDQQRSAWPSGSLKGTLEKLPELQVVHVAAESSDNVWVSGFRVQDGIADIETPTVFLATVSCSGARFVPNVQVTLTIDGSEVAGTTIDLEPGQTRQLEFKHQLDVQADPDRVDFVTATISLATDTNETDRLRNDNQRFLTLPVVAGLRVVCVDQYGRDEDLERNRIGETYRLRRLLAPTTGNAQRQQLVRISHTTVDQLDIDMLDDARLVVIAGVESPLDSTELLRQYVQQGGQLFMAAGADFDPAAWNELAWLDGAGILPAPLQTETIGDVPEVAVGEIKPFFIDFSSLQHDYFLIEGESREALEDLYHLPLFFKAAVADVESSTLDDLVASEKKRITEDRTFLEEWKRKQQSEEDANLVDDPETVARLNDINPQWLLWESANTESVEQLDPAEAARRTRPRVLARFADNNLPLLIERNIGRGRVVMMTSGVYSSWNTLTTTNAILLLDRVFRSMLNRSLPRRNFAAGETIALPINGDRHLEYTLQRPSGREDRLELQALTANSVGVNISDALHSGLYRVTTRNPQAEKDQSVSDIPLAVNGPVAESELEPLDAVELERRIGAGNYRWIEHDEQISLEGAQIRGRDLWKVLVRLVLLFLVFEMLVLAWPSLDKYFRPKEPTA